MLRPTTTGGTLTIRESHKDINSTSVIPFETEDQNNISLPFGSFSASLGLKATNGKFVTIDGIRAYTRNDFSLATDDRADIPKLKKFQGEISLGLRRADTTLSVEAIPMVTQSDTLFFHTQGLVDNVTYHFQLHQDKLVETGGTVVLKDSYTGIETELFNGQTIEYSFTTSADLTSKKENRFYVVLKQSTTLPVIITSARAYKKGLGNEVEWSTAAETQLSGFSVEKSPDGRKFANVAELKSKPGLSNDYNWFDALPFTNETFYRVKSIGLNGGITYSSILRVKGNTSANDISIFPNPVINSNFNVEINGLNAGTYTLILTNIKGEVLLSRKIEYNGGNQFMNIQAGAGTIPIGVYIATISQEKELVKTTKLVFE
jgi:hypothetical protein